MDFEEDNDSLERLFIDSSNTLQVGNAGFSFDLANVVISDSDVEDEDEQEFYQKTETGDLMELRNRMDLEINNRSDGGEGDAKAVTGRPARKRKRKSKFSLPPHLTNFMSEANFAYIQQNYVEAIAKLQDLIRHAPKTIEAWTLLAQVYMETGEYDKALAAYLISTQVDRKRIDLFQEAGSLATQLNRPEVALTCYNRVLRTLPGNVDCLLERARCQCALEQFEKASDTYSRILKHVPDNIKAREEWAHVLSALGKTNQAVTLLTDLGASKSPTAHILLGDLQMELGEYELAYADFTAAVALTTSVPASATDAEIIASLKDERIPIELQVRLGICRLYIDGDDNVATCFFDMLFAVPDAHNPVFYYEVVNSYVKLKLYEKALTILRLLDSWKSTNTPKTWEIMALCCYKMNQLEPARALYEIVLASDSNNSDVQIALADIYEQLGEDEKALELIERVELSVAEAPDADATVEDDKECVVALAKCDLLFRKPRRGAVVADFLRTAQKILPRFLNHRPFFKHMKLCRTGKWDQFHVSRVFRRFDFGVSNSGAEFADGKETFNADICEWQGVSMEDWYRFIMQFGTVAVDDGDSNRALSVIDRACHSLIFPPAKVYKLRLFMMSISVHTKQYKLLFDLCRWFCNRHRQSDFFFRVYMQVANMNRDTFREFYSSYHTSRWCKRQLQYRQSTLHKPFTDEFLKDAAEAGVLGIDFKTSNFDAGMVQKLEEAFSPTLSLFMGHQCSNTKFFRLAILHYLRAFVVTPHDTLVNLCLAVSCISRAMQRQTENRIQYVKLGLGFLFSYYNLCVEQDLCLAEACFNVGRALHQLNLVSYAVTWYKKVLSFEGSSMSSLAAYQLSLIYLNSNAGVLGKRVLYDYCKF